ncbi:hypothetical protein ACLMJK_002990 [Lecanora helva]
MESPAKELSPSPSAAPSTKGFKGVVAKARLGRNKDESTPSLNGSDEGSDPKGIRHSVDSLIDKARDGRKTSVDDEGLPPAPSNFSKLVPGRVKKKRRKREAAEQLQQELAEGRGRSEEDQIATAAESNKVSKDNRSRSTLGEDAGSLITLDSETDSPPATRTVTKSPPPLVSHQSHAGYLTSSSPLIKTTVASDTPADMLSQTDNPELQNPQYNKSNTFDTASSIPSINLIPQHAATMDSTEGGRSLNSRDGSRSRGISPGAKIKDVFSMGTKKKNASPPKSPDRATVGFESNGNGLGAFFGKDKKGSVNIGRDKTPDGSKSADTKVKGTQSSVHDLPAIAVSPRTPTSASLEAPETHVTPPTPTDQRSEFPSNPSLKGKGTNANTIVSPSGNMISHRRVRSDSASHLPSKLSNAMSAPLTPMAEESKSSGPRSPGASSPPGGSGGFFSSVFSAAQNAASQLSNTIVSNQPRSRSSTQTTGVDGPQDSDASTVVINGGEEEPLGEEKKLAVDTLGTGNLSLSHLGISTPNSSTTSLPRASSDRSGVLVQRAEAAARAENASAARAVSQAYSEKITDETTSTPIAEDVVPAARPRSTYESSIMTGDKTPPNGSLHESDHTFRRSGSVRSRVGTIAKRHRNSSSATGGTIGAAIAAGHAGLANPSAPGSTPKLTGFAVASKKRNRDFHNLFKSVPEDDYLIEDYSCALQRDIILAGRIYVSEGHICFSSNILGWVTTLIINFDEIVSVEKENTAVVFPNAIAIQTLHARHTFRSLLSREATYDLLIGIWKINHPSLKSSLNGVRLDQGGTGDKTEKLEPSGSDDNSDATEEEEEEEVYDEDEEDDEGTGSFTEVPEGSIVGGDSLAEPAASVTRKASGLGVAVGAAAGGVPTPNDAKAGEKAAAASAVANVDFPGPATHAPTECTDVDSHYDKFLKDDIVPAPLGKVYSMVFGPASGGYMARWLLDEMKCTDVQMEDDKKGLSEENKVRTFSYIKPLYASIGPKSTKCVVTETLDFIDLERSVSVTASTQTPDVPSGNVFATKTRFCFMWAPGNATRVVMNFNIEWTGKSWLKGPIEKGAADGQKTYGDDLIKALKTGVTSRPRAGTTGSKLKKGKRRKGETGPTSKSQEDDKPAPQSQQDSSWGLFEPLHGVLGSVADILSPVITPNVIIGTLLLIMLVNWLRGPTNSPSSGLINPSMTSSQRLAAYEEVWRREESDLWSWLEERIGMQGLAYANDNNDREAFAKARKVREDSLKGKGVKKGLAEVRMSDKDIDHAISVTEEKLGVLKRSVQELRGLQRKDELEESSSLSASTSR